MLKMNAKPSSQDLIYEDIKKCLFNKSIAKDEEGRLPSLRQLASQYGTSVGTVRQALQKLEFEKHIRAGHGKGYFILPPQQKTKQVIVLERLKVEDHFSGFLSQFQKYFSSFQHILVSFEDPSLMKNERASAILKRIRENPDDFEGMFFDTQTFEDNFTMDELVEIMGKIKLFHYFHTSDECREFGIPGVSTDWHHGGYIGTRHLTDVGCRNILVISHVQSDFTKGCEDAVADSTFNVNLRVSIGKEIGPVRKLFSENTFDAIYANADCRLLPVMPLLRELNLKVPDDIAILGYFNTPWAHELAEVPISSVSIREDEMINEVCDMCAGRSISCLKVLKPKLMPRESTLGFKKSERGVVAPERNIS